MLISSNWYDTDKSILYLHFDVGWQWRDLHMVLTHLMLEVKATGHAVALVMDFQRTPLLPPHEFTANTKKLITYYQHVGINQVVFSVGEPSIARLLEVGHRHFAKTGCEFTSASTLEDAVNKINASRRYPAVAIDIM